MRALPSPPFMPPPTHTHPTHPAASELSSVLSFLMQLGFRRVGQPCALSALGPSERTIAGHMMQLGVLMPFKQQQGSSLLYPSGGGRNSSGGLYFCPTRLAASLCDGFKQNSLMLNADIAGGHVIVETNYRVRGERKGGEGHMDRVGGVGLSVGRRRPR